MPPLVVAPSRIYKKYVEHNTHVNMCMPNAHIGIPPLKLPTTVQESRIRLKHGSLGQSDATPHYGWHMASFIPRTDTSIPIIYNWN